MSKRKVLNIIQYDYTSYEEYLEHREKMKDRGYNPIEEIGIGEYLKNKYIINNEKWIYTAYFYKEK